VDGFVTTRWNTFGTEYIGVMINVYERLLTDTNTGKQRKNRSKEVRGTAKTKGAAKKSKDK